LIKDSIVTFLWSISPFGEAKVGIPYGIFHDLNIFWVLLIAVVANILVFPIMMFFLEHINRTLLRWHAYKTMAIWIARRAKLGSGDKIKKYGFLGLILFVMIPLPGTGVYAGSIAGYIFKVDTKTAFKANVIGIIISSLIVWGTTLFAKGLA
jgi:uncharacterized membrane protein